MNPVGAPPSIDALPSVDADRVSAGSSSGYNYELPAEPGVVVDFQKVGGDDDEEEPEPPSYPPPPPPPEEEEEFEFG